MTRNGHPPHEERFLANHQQTDGCWIWTGSTTQDGYGRLKVHYRWNRAHRYSYAYYVGPIPAGLNVLHRCDNRRCVNPDHLFLGTVIDNNLDMVAKGRNVPPPRGAGESNTQARYTAEQVIAIRQLHYDAGVSAPQIAHDLAISVKTIRDILTGRRWGHVPDYLEHRHVLNVS